MARPPDERARDLAEAVGKDLSSRGLAPGALAPAGEPIITARSVLYFLGAPGSGPSLVVKCPLEGDPWVDTDPVLTAESQYAALVQAFEWQRGEDRHAVSRPVALLPDREALVMEYVTGPTVARVVQRALIDRGAARSAVSAAGDFLRRFHSHGRAGEVELDLAGSVGEVRRILAGPGREAGLRLPPPLADELGRVRRGTVRASQVLLHGDFVPSNLVVTGRDRLTMLDPTLARTAPPEEDLARFLAVLSSDSVFLPGIAVPWVRRLRRTLEQDFRSAYGLAPGPCVLLELRLLKQLLLRWLRRREHSRLAGRSGAMAVRRALLDRHMSALVAESAHRLAQGRTRAEP